MPFESSFYFSTDWTTPLDSRVTNSVVIYGCAGNFRVFLVPDGKVTKLIDVYKYLGNVLKNLDRGDVLLDYSSLNRK